MLEGGEPAARPVGRNEADVAFDACFVPEFSFEAGRGVAVGEDECCAGHGRAVEGVGEGAIVAEKKSLVLGYARYHFDGGLQASELCADEDGGGFLSFGWMAWG